MASPAASNWPGSPSVPRPSPARPGQSPSHAALHSPQAADHKIGSHISRVLPPRSWAGAVPTLITHEALDVLCCATSHPSNLQVPDMCPLERFLGCIYMRRQLQRFIQADECVRMRVSGCSKNDFDLYSSKLFFIRCIFTFIPPVAYTFKTDSRLFLFLPM